MIIILEKIFPAITIIKIYYVIKYIINTFFRRFYEE